MHLSFIICMCTCTRTYLLSISATRSILFTAELNSEYFPNQGKKEKNSLFPYLSRAGGRENRLIHAFLKGISAL